MSSRTTKIIAKTLAILAGVGLILSGFAVALSAEAQTITTTTIKSPSVVLKGSATFARDLTIGSTGADVTALQKWLLDKSFSIPAGATGYFGTQTQAAVAAYQAANGITPAVGYFGPITRARVNTTDLPVPAPEPDEDSDEDDEDDEDEEQDEESEAEESLEDTRDALENAREEVEEADEDGQLTGTAERLLDDAEDLIEDAEDELEDGDYGNVMEILEEAQEHIDEALDEIEADDNDDDVDSDDNVETSAEVNDRDGADNDLATFEIEFNLNAFNQDAYIDEDTSVSVNYEVQDSNGDDVGGATSLSALLQASADQDGDYFVIQDGQEETFTLTVSFDPLAVDEGAFYRLQLESVEFNDTDAAPDQTWTARPESRFRTDYVYIAD